jgi:hypothetical protein
MLQVRNYNKLLLAALLLGAAGTALATPQDCGTNLQWEFDNVTGRLTFTSPDPTQPATMAYPSVHDPMVIADIPWNEYRTSITSIVFPENLTNIAAFAFSQSAVTSVTLPTSLTLVGSNAFYFCTSLTDVELSNVQNIATQAFMGCTSLNNVVIPPTVTNIGVQVFYGCSALSNVLCRRYYAPTLGTDAFTECNAGLQICVPALGTYKNATNWSNYYDNLVLTQCEFLDESDEQSNTEAKINAYRYSALTSVTLFRTLRKAGCFNTLTLPFSVPDLAFSPLGGDNVEVYTFTDATVENNELIFDIAKVNNNRLEAGVPYLIQWNNTGEIMTRMYFTDIDGWDADNTAETTSGTGVTYHGFYGKTHISDDTQGEQHLNLFLGGGNQLYWPTDGDDLDAKMLGFRAWFRINGSSVSGAPVRRGMPATLRIVSTPTGVEDPFTPNPSPLIRKEFRNGQLVIIRNGQTFSLNGQRL